MDAKGAVRPLDMENIARIALMFLDGDKLEDVLIDKLSTDGDDITYRHDDFNDLKITLLKIEKINPDLQMTAILWQLRPDNPKYAVPVVCGSNYPYEGTDIIPITPELEHVFQTGEAVSKTRSDGVLTHYYPLKNSDDESVGVLDLTCRHHYIWMP